MSARQIQWLILIIPTVTIGVWEYLRHTAFMLERLSMEAGNYLSPVLVFAVTMVFVRPLMQRLNDMQLQLRRERESKTLMAEREQLARALHDGMAQTMFLLSVKLHKL